MSAVSSRLIPTCALAFPTRPKAALTASELADRRRAAESALGSLRVEGMELEP